MRAAGGDLEDRACAVRAARAGRHRSRAARPDQVSRAHLARLRLNLEDTFGVIVYQEQVMQAALFRRLLMVKNAL